MTASARLLTSVLQAGLLLALAPLLTGAIRTAKANLQSRRGPGVLQPYRDIAKLFRKGMTVSEHASPLFHVAPPALFITALVAGLLVPVLWNDAPLAPFGGLLAVVGLLALGRFAIALAALDTGSAFGGMGSSREMTVSALAEPALVLALFTVALLVGSTDLGDMVTASLRSARWLSASSLLAFASLFIVLLAETGRVPVDNPATHLELTMIHEAMVLEYSGPYLALVEWGSALKQLVLMTLLVNLFVPYGLAEDLGVTSTLAAGVWYTIKIAALAFAVVLVETTNAKLRLFRVPELLSVAFVLAALALALTVMT